MSNPNLEGFFKEEYQKISEAHFNVSERITSFFQYTIAIYAAPLLLFNENIKIEAELKGIVFLFIATIGFFICMYVNQLRCESLLYASTINNMRGYHFDTYAELSKNDNKYLSLPIQVRKPSFIDTYQFIWIVLTAAVVNAGYLIYGVTQLKLTIKVFFNIIGKNEVLPSIYESILLLVLFILVIIFQIVFYLIITRRVEAGLNFYNHSIGIDIDGVLNEHETQFCKIANNSYDCKIEPCDITKIPVHKINGIKVSEEQEQKIFNKECYWIDMPVKNKTSIYLKKIKERLGFNIFIFTWRPWGKNCTKEFNIEKITKSWLEKQGIKKWTIYKKIHFEKGNDNLPVSVKGALLKIGFTMQVNTG